MTHINIDRVHTYTTETIFVTTRTFTLAIAAVIVNSVTINIIGSIASIVIVVITPETTIGLVKKTGLLPALACRLTELGLKVATVPEPVDLWRENGILRDFYSDTQRWAETFQLMT